MYINCAIALTNYKYLRLFFLYQQTLTVLFYMPILIAGGDAGGKLSQILIFLCHRCVIIIWYHLLVINIITLTLYSDQIITPTPNRSQPTLHFLDPADSIPPKGPARRRGRSENARPRPKSMVRRLIKVIHHQNFMLSRS